MRARLWAAVLLLAAGCALPPRAAVDAPRAPSTLTLRSELPPAAAMRVAQATLRRAGWPSGPATATALTTGWRETPGGPVRLSVTASDAEGGAYTVLTMWGETRLSDDTPVPVVRPDRAGGSGSADWAVVEAAARRVEAEVRYARP